MKIIAGREVRETLNELVDPASTALVLIDFQNDFVNEDGVVARRGEGREASSRGLVPNTVRVLQQARQYAVPVVYLRYCRSSDHRFESAASLRWMVVKRGYGLGAVSAVEGTWGAAIVSALEPTSSDLVIDKRKASGFVGTSLHGALTEMGIRTLVLAGVSTHGCVEATARDAESHDYYVVLLEDCVGAYEDTLHRAALTVMASRYEVVPSEQLLECWSKAVRAKQA